MFLKPIDWSFIVIFFVISLSIGIKSSYKAGKSAKQFFLSGREMPWWLLGISMVATTFAADTPNLVTNIVRKNGVAGNWVWWAFLLTGMLTVFVYAKLWRRSGVMTDLEFYELRYSGKSASFLRGFRAVYLGVFFNVVIMANVCLAAVKIGGVLLGLSPAQILISSSILTVIYVSLGGLRSVLLTDLFQFTIAIIGAIAAAIVILRLPEIEGLSGLITHEAVQGKLTILPDFSDPKVWIPLFFIPLAVQWWSVWYPGAEPGGGGYIAQRMLAAKSENHALGATLLFNVAHYALRPWPWIIVALGSLIVFPNTESLRNAFPHMDAEIIRDDLAYPAMLTYLPTGLLGLVVASLAAAFISTISTHLNWGASYIVNDTYKRFIHPQATERQLVAVGRIATVGLIGLAATIALFLESALTAFHILLQIGAGTGLLFILRWFWWRINAFSEITAMVVSFLVALYFLIHTRLGLPAIPEHLRLCIGVGITTVAWITVTLMTPPSDKRTLRAFYRHIKPGGPGWSAVLKQASLEGDPIDTKGDGGWDLPNGILCMVFGCFAVYGALFATGFWIYGNVTAASLLSVMTLVAAGGLMKAWTTLKTSRSLSGK